MIRTVLQSTANKIVSKLMNWNQKRIGTRLHRVHTDCLGRNWSPQRSQNTVTLPEQGFKPAIMVSIWPVLVGNDWSAGRFWSWWFSMAFSRLLAFCGLY